jgi:hypothetical protein
MFDLINASATIGAWDFWFSLIEYDPDYAIF